MTTPSMEDYLETIFALVHCKGYARVSDIAERLGLQPSSVTKMVQRLADAGYVHYERYRGLVLTEAGAALGEALQERHRMLAEFLRLIGVPEETIHKDVEGIEHHVSPVTLARLEALVQWFRANPPAREALANFRPPENPPMGREPAPGEPAQPDEIRSGK